LPPRAIIAGAGVAGLTSAIALSQAGIRVRVYERANTLDEFGAGLQLTPNATRVLNELGVLDRVLPLGSKPSAIVVLRGSDNTELMRMCLEDAERRWGAAYLVIHRADLQRTLLDAACQSGVEMTLGATVLDFADDGARVSVGLARGMTKIHDEADLLIGADGLRSHVRQQLDFGVQNQPDFAGRIAYRAIVDANEADPQWMTSNVILRLGKNAHLVQYPLRSGSILNLVATIGSRSPSGGSDYPDREKEGRTNHSTLERALSGWSREARRLTKAPVQWHAWPIYHRSPLSSFSRGRVALVGDAAHPMAPFLAQGSAQAIEDAGALGRLLAQVQDIPAAVSMYSRDRVPRATRVQREALKLGGIYHMSGPSAFARDVTMRLLGTHALIRKYDWLYGG
jgi:salicylate hydroxylase